MSLIFVTHNLGLVKDVSDTLAVMYAGQIVETGSTKKVLEDPKHPYTQGLLRSLPSLKPSPGPIPVLQGQPPELGALPTGCAFHPRCGEKMDICPREDPTEFDVDKRKVRCHLYSKK